MIDGTAAIRSTRLISGPLIERGAYSLMNRAAPKPIGTATTRANRPMSRVPHRSDATPKTPASGSHCHSVRNPEPSWRRAGQAPMARNSPISPITSSVDTAAARAATTKTRSEVVGRAAMMRRPRPSTFGPVGRTSLRWGERGGHPKRPFT